MAVNSQFTIAFYWTAAVTFQWLNDHTHFTRQISLYPVARLIFVNHTFDPKTIQWLPIILQMKIKLFTVNFKTLQYFTFLVSSCNTLFPRLLRIVVYVGTE